MKVVGAAFQRWFGGFRVAYLPVLLTYLCFGASMVTGIALLYFEKDTLGLTPGQAAGIAFWLGLPWSMKMVVGVASDVRPMFGSRRGAYLIVGALCSLGGYAALAATVRTKAAYLAAMLLVTIGYMVQDVVADALSVEIARNDEEIGQIQTLGRMATLAGGIAVGLPSGWLVAALGSRGVFTCAMALPILVALSVAFLPRWRDAPPAAARTAAGRARRRTRPARAPGRPRLRRARSRARDVGHRLGPGDRARRLRRAAVISAHADGRDARRAGGRARDLHLPRHARRGPGLQLLGHRPSRLRRAFPRAAGPGLVGAGSHRPPRLPSHDRGAAGELHAVLGHRGGHAPLSVADMAFLWATCIVGRSCAPSHPA